MIVIISQDSASDHVWSIEEIAGLLETRSNEVLDMNETTTHTFRRARHGRRSLVRTD